jgi:hypothetical protein
MPATIVDTIPAESEIILVERQVTNEFRIREIHENIDERRVQVEIEFGPFVQENGPRPRIRGSGGRGVTVWEGEEYDQIRDTWNNLMLIEAVKAKIS